MNEEALEYFKGDELATGVWLGKYALEGEVTPDDKHRRMAKEFARVEEWYNDLEAENMRRGIYPYSSLSKYGSERDFLSEESIYDLFKNYRYIIPQGSVMSNLGSPAIGSLSNCFVIGQPEDSYGGIFQKDEELVQLMKRRGGVGIDISTLRPEGTPTTNAAKSSTGAVSFMHRFSNSTREVAQNGRRGALMVSISVNHPDVLEFIKIKRDLSQVTGANISVKISKEFMKAVENDEDYILRFPCDVKTSLEEWSNIEYNKLITFSDHSGGVNYYVKKIKAKEYWDEIIKSAHNVAEPGIIFEDNHHDYSPDGVYPQFKGVTTNPCGEIFMQPYDACRLMAINLFSFVDNPFSEFATFDFDKFYSVCYEAMRLSDDLIDLEVKHINRIIDKLYDDKESLTVKQREIDLWEKVLSTALESRRTGVGFTALGDMLAALGLPYDSDRAITFTEVVMKEKLKAELDCTIDLAVLRGTFKGWDDTLEYPHEVNTTLELFGNDFYRMVHREYPEQYHRMYKYGRRNVSWSTVAPTGSVSLLAQVTSGIEPLFMPFYMRRKKVNPGETGVRVDFTDQNGDTWQEFPVLHPKFKLWIQGISARDDIDWGTTFTEEDLKRLFEKSPWYGSTANDIDWIKRVEIQSVIQKYTTHSISATINLPNTVTEEEVSEIYMESWKKGLKGITVYRDGSRSGVLVSSNNTSRDTFEYVDAVKRPKELECDIFTSSSSGKKYNVIVGLLDNKPYEVFITEHFTNETKLSLRKIKKGRYDLIKDGETYSESITTEMSESEEAITRLVSTSLRHGTDIKFIVQQLTRTPSENMFSFTKVLARVLKKYIPDGATSTSTCNDCNSTNVIFEEGCNKCLDCGSSACS